MGNVLTLSEPSMDMMLYGDKSSLLTTYLQQQLQQLGPAFNDFGHRLHGSLVASYNYVTDKLIQYGIRNELSTAGLNVLDNQYIELLSWEALQQANPTMQRWVMAHPVVKQMYLNQDIDGYSNSYVNVFGDGVGEEDYNYRRLMSGVLINDVVKHFYDDLLPGDRELDHYEKDIGLNTFNTIDWLISTCDFDFTNQSSEPVKFNRS